MSWCIRWAALLLMVGFTLPLLGQAPNKPDEKKDVEKKTEEKKSDEPKPDDSKKDEKEKLLPAGTLAGKITNLNEEKRTLKVELTYTLSKLNEGEAQAYQAAQVAYQRAAANPQLKPQDRAKEMATQLQSMQQHYAKLYDHEKKTREIELQLTDDAKIRTAGPPIIFDDEGKRKILSKKELEELKGDPKLPGYPTELSTLGTGQIVQVTLVAKKGAIASPAVKPPVPRGSPLGAPGLPKPKDTGLNPDALAEHLPLVSIIVLMQKADK